MKNAIKEFGRRRGVYIASTDRMGIEVELELARLTASDPIRCIFDVGANFGQTAKRFLSRFPHATCYSFEPVPATYARLTESDNGYGYGRLKMFPVALGAEPGEVSINLTGDAGRSSARALAETTSTVQVKVDTVDAFCSRHEIEEISLLKIDVEGYEMPVLQGSRRMLESRAVRYVYAECKMSDEPKDIHTSFFDLHRHLTAFGFCFVCYYPESFELKMGSAMGNVLWALRSRLPLSATGKTRNIL